MGCAREDPGVDFRNTLPSGCALPKEIDEDGCKQMSTKELLDLK